MSKDRDEFVAVIAREIPELAVHHVAELAGALMKQGALMSRAAIALCNGEIEQDVYDRRKDRISDRIKAAFAEYAGLAYMEGKMPKIGYSLGGDPRGYCLHLMLPSKRYNTWGGESEGYGVPGS